MIPKFKTITTTEFDGFEGISIDIYQGKNSNWYASVVCDPMIYRKPPIDNKTFPAINNEGKYWYNLSMSSDTVCDVELISLLKDKIAELLLQMTKPTIQQYVEALPVRYHASPYRRN